ncbi:transposable element Tcb2 transposase [Trichonephila clavipes]|nr:transposable element Tcb2 transposase [Trichonephila clavipes]
MISRSQSHRACMGFSRQTLGRSYLTTSNDSGASIGAARRMGSNASTQLIDILILSMGRRCETCLAVRGDLIPLLKTGMFLAGHPSQGCFGLQSHCAPCYFFNQASFIPLISLLVSVAYITHVLTYWGSYGIKCVNLESFCPKLY